MKSVNTRAEDGDADLGIQTGFTLSLVTGTASTVFCLLGSEVPGPFPPQTADSRVSSPSTPRTEITMLILVSKPASL